MNKAVLMLGGNPLNYGIYCKWKKKGYMVYVADWNEQPAVRGDRHFQADVKDAEKILFLLEKEGLPDRLEQVYSSMDAAVVSAAYLSRAAGLNTISDEGLKRAVSKSEMTQKWEADGLLNRLSFRRKTYDESLFELNADMKLIVKPDNAASSRGITVLYKNSPKKQCRQAFQKAVREASNRTAVIEEFVEGTEYTAEMLGDVSGNVCVYGISEKSHTKNTTDNRIAVRLHYGCTPPGTLEKIAHFAVKCYQSLGFSACFGHLELILKEDGQMSPIEIGARSSGFIASDLTDIVSGADYLADLCKVQHGLELKEGMHQQTGRAGVYFFYDFPAGFRIGTEHHLMEYMDQSISSRYYDRSGIVQGRCFQAVENDSQRTGYEILEGPKERLTQQYVLECEKKMMYEMTV